MFILFTFLISINLCISGISTAASTSTCKINDDKCLENFLYTVAEKIFSGEPAQNIEGADPLFFDRIDGNLDVLKYKLLNSNITGLSRCKVKNIKVNINSLLIRLDVECPPNAKIIGKYEVNGKFLSWPVEGHGDYTFVAGSFKVNIKSELEILTNKNDKKYLKVNNFKSKTEVTSPFKADFKNLFNGQKKLSDALLKFAHENWKISADYVQEPLVNVVMKRLLGNVNKLLRTTPLDS